MDILSKKFHDLLLADESVIPSIYYLWRQGQDSLKKGFIGNKKV